MQERGTHKNEFVHWGGGGGKKEARKGQKPKNQKRLLTQTLKPGEGVCNPSKGQKEGKKKKRKGKQVKLASPFRATRKNWDNPPIGAMTSPSQKTCLKRKKKEGFLSREIGGWVYQPKRGGRCAGKGKNPGGKRRGLSSEGKRGGKESG